MEVKERDKKADFEESELSQDVDTGAGQGIIKPRAIFNKGQQEDFLAKLKQKLSSLPGTSSGYIESLPLSVKRRVQALKKMQLQSYKVEETFYQEIHLLECKFSAMYDEYFEKRRQIICGELEPTENDCDLGTAGVEEEDMEETTDELAVAPPSDIPVSPVDEVIGIPGFWLSTFKNVAILADMIQIHDEPILHHLTDVCVKLHDDPMGFTLEFHFGANKFFTDSVLTKQYSIKCHPDPKNPFSFDGPEIISSRGCKIQWNKGENVTLKTVVKRQKHKSKGAIRTVTKTVLNDSFFNFFNPPTPSPNEAVDDETAALLSSDFEIGHFLKERVIPKSVLYFTGEAMNEDEDADEEEEEDDGSEENLNEDNRESDSDKELKSATKKLFDAVTRSEREIAYNEWRDKMLLFYIKNKQV